MIHILKKKKKTNCVVLWYCLLQYCWSICYNYARSEIMKVWLKLSLSLVHWLYRFWKVIPKFIYGLCPWLVFVIAVCVFILVSRTCHKYSDEMLFFFFRQDTIYFIPASHDGVFDVTLVLDRILCINCYIPHHAVWKVFIIIIYMQPFVCLGAKSNVRWATLMMCKSHCLFVSFRCLWFGISMTLCF